MRRLVAVLAIAGVSVSVYRAASGEAGPANRIAECPARISDELRALAADAGIVAGRYERIRVGVKREVTADWLTFVLPPLAPALRRGVEVPDWSACDLYACTAFGGTLCGLWGTALPLRLAPNRTCVRAAPGLPCPRIDRRRSPSDVMGAASSYTSPRSEAVDPAQCQPVECVVLAGEEGDL